MGAGPRWWFGAGWCWLFLFSGGGASGAAFGFSFLLVCGCFLAACAGRCACVSFIVRVFFVWRAPRALRVRCCGGPARVFFLVLGAGAVRAPKAWRAFVFFCGARCASSRVAAVLAARVCFSGGRCARWAWAAVALAACVFCCWRARVLGLCVCFSVWRVYCWCAARLCVLDRARRRRGVFASGSLARCSGWSCLSAGSCSPPGPLKNRLPTVVLKTTTLARRCSPWRVSDYFRFGNFARRRGARAGGARCPAALDADAEAVDVPVPRARRAGRVAGAGAPGRCCVALEAGLVSFWPFFAGLKIFQKVFFRGRFGARKISKNFFSRCRRAAPWIGHFYCALRFFMRSFRVRKKKFLKIFSLRFGHENI